MALRISLIVPVLATIILLCLTHQNKAAISGDSYRYMSMAKHIAVGKGVQIYHKHTGGKEMPMVWFAPLWPALLSIPTVLGLPFENSTWIILSLLLVVNLWLVGAIVYHATKKNYLAITAQLLLFLDTHFLTWHFHVLTEALCYALVNLAIYLLLKYSTTQKKKFLLFSLLSISLVPLNRYVGIVYLPAFLICYYLTLVGSFFQRIKKIILCVIFISFPISLWFFRNYLVSGMIYDKSLPGVDSSSYYPLELILNLFYHLSAYILQLFNVSHGFFAYLTLVLISAVVCAPLITRSRNMTVDFLSVFFLIYIFGLSSAMIWRHLSTVTDPVRYLTPAMTHLWPLFLIVVNLVTDVMRKKSRSVDRGVAGAIIALTLFFLIPNFINWSQKIYHEGIDGSRHKQWDFINDTIKWFPDPPYR